MAVILPQPQKVDTEHLRSAAVVFQDANGVRRTVDANDPLPVTPTGTPGLPTGAATSAKQDTQITAEQAILAKLPVLGVAATPSTDVITTRLPAVTKVMSTAFEASKVLKNATGALVHLTVFNSGPAQFILVMNSTTVTADGAVTLLVPPIPVAAGQLLVWDFPTPVAFAGCSVSNSSTGTFTKAIGSADCAFFAQVY